MKTGIIGAGRVGCSLGKYFRSKNADLVGYYDTNAAAAEEAAAFTQTAGFNQVQQLVRESDILFITTPGFIYYTGLGTIKRAVSNESDYMSL